MLGFAADEMLGHELWGFLVEDEREKARREHEEGLAGVGSPDRHFERQFRHRGGRQVPVLVQSRLLRDSGGNIIGTRATIQDISEQKKVGGGAREAHRRAAGGPDQNQDTARPAADLQLVQEDSRRQGLLEPDRDVHSPPHGGRFQPRSMPGLRGRALPRAEARCRVRLMTVLRRGRYAAGQRILEGAEEVVVGLPQDRGVDREMDSPGLALAWINEDPSRLQR